MAHPTDHSKKDASGHGLVVSRRGAIARLAAIAGASLAPVSCERGGSAQGAARAPGPLRIAVTIPPLAGLVRALAPSDARVTVLMTPGRSEHGYEFTPSDLAEMGRADLVVYIGLHLEARVEGFLSDHPSARRVDLCFARAVGVGEANPAADAAEPTMIGRPNQPHDYTAAHDDHDHAADDHEEGHDHDGHRHGAIDPHVWLDPVLVLTAVPALADAVKRAATGAGVSIGDLPARADALVESLRSLDKRHLAALGPFAGASIVTHHSAWGRLAERYGLHVAAVIREIESGEPTPGKIAASVEAIKAQRVKTVFVEPQFNPDAARRIAEAAGVKLGTLDPLGDGDYFGMMEKNLTELVKGLGG